MTYRVEDDGIWWEGERLGPAACILIDAKQADVRRAALDSATNDYIIAQLPVGDYVFVSDSGLLCIVEEKRRSDLSTSYRARRLQRQLRDMRKHDEACVVLALRATTSDAMSALYDYRDAGVALDLLKWQVLGGLIGVLPADPTALLRVLHDWRAVLQPGRHLLSILAGDDRPARRAKEVKGLTPTAQALSRLIRGVGPTVSSAWAAAGKEDVVRALRLSDKKLAAAGLNKTVRARLKEVLDGE